MGTTDPRTADTNRRPADTVDVAVIGGGLAGLTAATFAARAGARVTLLDARSVAGGRARTADHDGFRFNEGPHALYRASEGTRILRELGIAPRGGNPAFVRSRLALDGRLRRMPPARAIRQVAGLLRRAGADAGDPGLVGISAADWIDGRIADPVGRQLAAAVVRLSSYSGDLTTFSADGAATQLALAVRGVTYLHDGWSQLVTALLARATAAGVVVETGAKVGSVDRDGDRWAIGFADDRRLVAASVVLAAGGPGAAARLVGGASAVLDDAAAAAVPVHAACLDLGLRRLPRPSVRFVLGVDRPSYASVHTPGARLADDGHVVHLLRYEPGDEVGIDDLEALADELQPGWRPHETARQVGVRRVVAFDRPQPGRGLRGRPGTAVGDLPGVFVAGDWVGPTDLLAGAAITSGRAAGLAAAVQP